jgi:periplasmic protein CpxP/Spy
MSKILTLTSTLIMLLTIAPIAPAQNADRLAKIQAVAEELKLTPEQKEKVIPILKEEAPKLEAIKSNTSMSGFQKMRELRAIHNQTAPQLQQILSPAQYQKLQAIRETEIKKAMAAKRAAK